MMGTLAGVLATKKIRTHTDRFLCLVEGDIEDVGGILKITGIRVDHTSGPRRRRRQTPGGRSSTTSTAARLPRA